MHAAPGSRWTVPLAVGKTGGQGSRLLDLGNPVALKWLIGHMTRLVREQGIDMYRLRLDPVK